MVSSPETAIPDYEIWIDTPSPHAEESHVALLQNKKVVALEIDTPTCTPNAGALFLAKVIRDRTELNAVELDIGLGTPVFMKKPGTKNKPAENRKKEHNKSTQPPPKKKSSLKTGDLLTVEWLASAAAKDKLPTVRAVTPLPEGGESIENSSTAAPTPKTSTPACLQPAPDALTRLWDHPRLSLLTEEQKTRIPINYDSFELLDITGQIEALIEHTVTLEGIAGTSQPAISLTFDTTEAAHIIDVNGSGNLQSINRRALKEIARQIELRNLAGIILIDLAGDKRKLSPGLCETMRKATRNDPCKVDVYGITKLGLMEITRTRRGWPLSQILAASSAAHS